MVKYLTKYKYIVFLGIGVVGCLLYYYIDPSTLAIAPKCPVKLLTGLDCPGCGFQRALHASLHAHFVEAIHYNLFLLIALPITLIWCLNGIVIENTSIRIKSILLYFNRSLIYFYIFCYACWFLIRNIYNV